jgi:hypothetical protein
MCGDDALPKRPPHKTQFAEPGLELANQNFGQITNTLNDGRTFRFTLQVSW